MCDRRNTDTMGVYFQPMLKGNTPRIDGCMTKLIYVLNENGIKTLGCCCGHGRYRTTVVFEHPRWGITELLSGTVIKRKRRFYKTDKEGYYYIPEVEERLVK